MIGLSVVGLQRLRQPGANAVAIMFGLEAVSRGVVAAVLPLQTVALLGSDEALSMAVLAGACFSILLVMSAPIIARRIGRARLATLAAAMAVGAALLFIAAFPVGQVGGFMMRAGAVALMSVSLNLFIMDHIKRGDLSRSEPRRMLAVGVGWMVGPVLGIWLDHLLGPTSPYFFSAAAIVTLIGYFWILRRRGPEIVKPAKTRSFANPIQHLGAFTRQKRLMHAWLISVGRGIFWMSFFIYTPVYAVEVGLGREAGGIIQSLGSAMLLGMPFYGFAARRFGIRKIATIAFIGAAIGCSAGWVFSDQPYIGAAGILIATGFMAMNDGYGNALFFRACRPSQREGMASVFTTYRDSAELFQAAFFAVLLSFLPIETVYLAMSIILLLLAASSRAIHPRL